MNSRTITSRVREIVGAPGRDPLPSYAWPGGYPLVYRDGAVICPTCARSKRWSDKQIIGAEIHWEGPAEVCENCGREIPAAYGYLVILEPD